MADTFLFTKNKKIERKNVLLDATIRDFSGGWNVIDNDLNLSTKYSKILRNMQRNEDGSNAVRHGTRLFSDTVDHLDAIIACSYYNGHIISVGKNGKLTKTGSDGVSYVIWDDEWAGNLSGAPDGWDTGLTFASMAEFNGKLIVCNGINKPLIIDSNIMCTYLNDPATGNQTNTPIARFVTTHGRYLVMAGNATNIDRLYIASTDTSGVWVGDGAPNDAVNLDLGSRVPSGSFEIKGINSFRDKLLVMFDEIIIVGTLGIFSGSTHEPTFEDAIEEHGAISHRVAKSIGEDILFADTVGVTSVGRALFTGTVRPERYSQLIDPEIQNDINNITSTATLEDRTFAVYDAQRHDYMLFIPNHNDLTDTTQTRCFVFKKDKKLKVEAWYEFTNWNWQSGCRSALKRVFFTNGTQIFIYGNEQDKINKDREGAEEMWDDDTPWSDYTGWSPVADAADSGIAIPFVWELPWTDAGQRFLTKASRFINFDTIGDQQFTCSMFVDNIYKDKADVGEAWLEDDTVWDDDLGWDVEALDPLLSMTFAGGDSPGFGADEYGENYGGGRPTRLEKLYAWPARYKINKLRIEGDATDELRFVSISMAYNIGSPRRA